jgi:hypothetical protein
MEEMIQVCQRQAEGQSLHKNWLSLSKNQSQRLSIIKVRDGRDVGSEERWQTLVLTIDPKAALWLDSSPSHSQIKASPASLGTHLMTFLKQSLNLEGRKSYRCTWKKFLLSTDPTVNPDAYPYHNTSPTDQIHCSNPVHPRTDNIHAEWSPW